MATDKQSAPAAPPLPRSRRGFKGFFSEVGRELKRVNWPTRAETNRLTGVVLGVCLFAAVIISGMSWISSILISLITKGKVG
jgi:preprotein translocase SecE subunit